MSLDVTVVTPDRTIWSGEATQVVVPALDGSLGILTGMQPTLAILGAGSIRVIGADGTESFPVDGGFVSMDRDVVTIGVDEILESDPMADAGRSAR
ncbi:F0F1 ATP synthase subunit epsilon [Brachybacterium huguangmaarense]